MEDKARFMGSLSRLKDAEQDYKCISVTHDYSQEDRAKIKNKVKEAKELGQSKNEVYRVMGPPWDLRLIKVQK